MIDLLYFLKKENSYTNKGAMPGLVHIKNKREKIEYLYQIVQAYLLKDIKSLVKEENIRAFNHLLFYIAEHQGQVMPVNKI